MTDCACACHVPQCCPPDPPSTPSACFDSNCNHRVCIGLPTHQDILVNGIQSPSLPLQLCFMASQQHQPCQRCTGHSVSCCCLDHNRSCWCSTTQLMRCCMCQALITRDVSHTAAEMMQVGSGKARMKWCQELSASACSGFCHCYSILCAHWFHGLLQHQHDTADYSPPAPECMCLGNCVHLGKQFVDGVSVYVRVRWRSWGCSVLPIQ